MSRPIFLRAASFMYSSRYSGEATKTIPSMELRSASGSKVLRSAGFVEDRFPAVLFVSAVLRLFSFPVVSRPTAFLMVTILIQG